MSYLLDTHTLLWFLVEAHELPVSTQRLIEEADDVHVSIVSFWEMAIKDSTGKFRLPYSITEMMRLRGHGLDLCGRLHSRIPRPQNLKKLMLFGYGYCRRLMPPAI